MIKNIPDSLKEKLKGKEEEIEKAVLELRDYAKKDLGETDMELEEAAEKAVLSVFTGYADLNTPFREEKIALVGGIFKAGAQWQKEQMMKDAIDAVVCKRGNNTYLQEMDKDAIAKVLAKYNDFDRVKVIIVKED